MVASKIDNQTLKNNLPIKCYIENEKYEDIMIPDNSTIIVEDIKESYHPY